jgi:hypothetical protein
MPFAMTLQSYTGPSVVLLLLLSSVPIGYSSFVFSCSTERGERPAILQAPIPWFSMRKDDKVANLDTSYLLVPLQFDRAVFDFCDPMNYNKSNGDKLISLFSNFTEFTDSNTVAASPCEANGNCLQDPKCCSAGSRCYEKDKYYGRCFSAGTCVPGFHADDPPEYRTPWSCNPLYSQQPPWAALFSNTLLQDCPGFRY